jgi:hypothetical protein
MLLSVFYKLIIIQSWHIAARRELELYSAVVPIHCLLSSRMRLYNYWLSPSSLVYLGA